MWSREREVEGWNKREGNGMSEIREMIKRERSRYPWVKRKKKLKTEKKI